MKEFLKEIAPIMPQIVNMLWAILFMVKFADILKFLRDMLSEPDNRLSSRRGIAMGAAWTMFYLCCNFYATVPPLVMWVLLLLIILCLGLATLPQIMELWVSIKGFIAGGRETAKNQPEAPAQVNMSTEVQVQQS